MDPSVLKRVPVLVSEDDRYFQDTWQGIPAKGYTALFERMLDYPGVEVRLGTEASERLRVRRVHKQSRKKKGAFTDYRRHTFIQSVSGLSLIHI